MEEVSATKYQWVTFNGHGRSWRDNKVLASEGFQTNLLSWRNEEPRGKLRGRYRAFQPKIIGNR
jgi:hypothetical protein